MALGALAFKALPRHHPLRVYGEARLASARDIHHAALIRVE
jgi:hypothetical protein